MMTPLHLSGDGERLFDPWAKRETSGVLDANIQPTWFVLVVLKHLTTFCD